MKKMLIFLLAFGILSHITAQTTENFKTYKLDNGLTIVLDRDVTQSMVFGIVAINAGSQDEELNATGIAHYLEHMLFKGTTSLGTSDWEKEKPHIENIYKLYDKLQYVKTEDEIKNIHKEINEESQNASKYTVPNELSNLVQQMGGVGLNAFTGFDQTAYHNSFPPNQLERWLDLYAHRFVNPVFRLFQTELETVYEEKNSAEDGMYNAYSNNLMKEIFRDHPYGRPIIGLTDHLKKPWMSRMDEFFNKWYVPNNMILVLSGNFDIKQAENLIDKKFGVWEAKTLPERNYPPIKPFKGKQTVKVKLTPFLRGELVYRGVGKLDKDELVLEVVSKVLSNSAQTGLLDKLNMAGEVMFVGASNEQLKDGGIFSISFAPVFDINQRRQLSFKSAESLIKKQVSKLKAGDYEDWLLSQIKDNMIKNHKLLLESPSQRALTFVDLFIRDKDVKLFFAYKKLLSAVTKAEVSKVANKYLGNDYLAFYSYKGEADKEKIKKPKIDPIKPVKPQPSLYASKFVNIPTTKATHHFVEMNKEIQQTVFDDKIKLFYVPNKRNDVFSMDVVFHAGTHKFPKLKYAVSLMNNAGIMTQYKPDELRKEFGKLGVSYSFFVDSDYTSISLEGREENLGKACQLLSRLMLLSEIEDKALDRIIGSEYQQRMIGESRAEVQSSALRQYIQYGDKSSFLDRISLSDLSDISPSQFVGELSKALSYNADIHFYGKMPIEELKDVLKKNLAFGSNRKEGTSPERKPKNKYDKTTIYLVNNSKATQSQIFFFMNGVPKTLEQKPLINAFNQYFGGGFNGLMMKEIREYRSLAYSAGARYSTPILTQWNSNLTGTIGTQADKTVEAVSVVVDLLNSMPEYSERMSSIKDYLINSSYMARPSDRGLSYSAYYWKLRGYKEDPVKFNLPYYNNLQFEDIVSFYNENIKGKPYVIGIVGDMRKIDKKSLAKYGKIITIKNRKLFSQEKK